jgi:hypothetical protein
MYKFSDNQISFTDFNMPNGVELNPENRWVKKAELIPWNEIELRYAKFFTNKKGNVAKPLRMALGAVLIYSAYSSFSDEEVVNMIQENPYMQFFCGLPEYTDERPFDPSLMVYFRKRLTPEIIGEINEMIIAENTVAEPKNDNKNNDDDNDNYGDLIVDSTCAPQNIKFPQDINLLNESRENLEAMIDKLHKQKGGVKPRTYRKNARRDYLNCVRKKNKKQKQIRKAIKQQIHYMCRDFNFVLDYLNVGCELSDKDLERFNVISVLYDQQLEMYHENSHSCDNRIVSLHQPWVRPIIRGKSASKVEFGAKLDISVSDGFTRLEHTSFDAYNEGKNLIDIILRFKNRTGHFPKRVLADKIYRNRDNIKFCQEHGIEFLGKPLGRPRKDYIPDKKAIHKSEKDRIEVERKFSQAKGSHGLAKIKMRLKETSLTAIALSVLALNIAHIERILCCLFDWLFGVGKVGFVQ